MVGAKEPELVAAGCFENESEGGGIRTTTMLGAARLDVGDAILDAMVHDHASAGGDDVAIPVHVGAVGELGDESLGSFGQDHRRFVAVARFASDVADERERPVPRASYLARDPVQCFVEQPEEAAAGCALLPLGTLGGQLQLISIK